MNSARVPGLVEPAFRLLGFLGVASLAYAAGYTRAVVVENDVPITLTREIISIPGLPTWPGLLASLGMGLVFLYIVATAVLLR